MSTWTWCQHGLLSQMMAQISEVYPAPDGVPVASADTTVGFIHQVPSTERAGANLEVTDVLIKRIKLQVEVTPESHSCVPGYLYLWRTSWILIRDIIERT